MRLIDADKLKHLRNEVISGKLDIQTEGDLIDACPTVNPYEWINVKDRLPEKFGRYLTACREMSIAQIRLWEGTWDSLSEVTHWMPLPTLPTEKEN